ncbi:PH domain-containing protein [Paraferrimonas sp. SM1919]|uniref:PH domain-containing protein n=1 Tax=Paraferrimonas sp. SM1919 TaxID=2662263 RepID=UPI0013D30B30|nr:PH domain-containing protein [Paraferrimonas sp. SM1919]
MADTNQNQAAANWQRVSPVGLIYFVIQVLKGFVGNVIYLIPMVYLLSDLYAKKPETAQLMLLGAAIIISLFAGLNYYFFQYRLTKARVEIRSGVFSKKRIDLPFSRIQNIEVSEPLYYRPIGFCYLQFDTAGSSTQEAKIVAINLDKAKALKSQILAHNQAQADTAEAADVEMGTPNTPIQSDEKPINYRNIDDLVLHGLTSNRAWILLAGLSPFIDEFTEKLSSWLLRYGINVEQYFAFEGMTWWQIGLTLITVTVTTIIIMSLISVIGSIIVYYNFELAKQGDRYIRRCGLFTVTEVSMRLSRLQVIVRQQDWLDTLFRRSNLKYEQSNANAKGKHGAALTNKILVPSVTHSEVEFLINDAYPDNQLLTIKLNKISPRYLLRNIGALLVPPFIVISAFLGYHNNYEAMAYAFGLFALLSGLMVMRYLRWGYAMDDNFVYIRKGCLGVDHYCFPRHKVQQISVSQNPIIAKHQLCSLHFVLASGSYTIPYMDEQQAYQMLNSTLYEVEYYKKSWM